MGALEFVPECGEDDDRNPLDMASLANLASDVYLNRFNVAPSADESITMKKLIYLGTSAGGKRPKAVVAYNPHTGVFRSGHIHSLGVMGKKTSVSIADFMEFAEDFVDRPKEKIERVLTAVDRFGQWCDNYRIDSDVREKIQSVLIFLRPR